ncbi:hypothetical protein GCM10009750_05500 [Agromyces salentinus]|uniref:Uncharacterized protein n=1 Tax=Agromyces salentinus TaxID=269421 RepID=A0ABN2MHB8_9MICO
MVRLEQSGSATLVLHLSGDGLTVETITVSGQDVAGPMTPEGIGLGSSTEELLAAHTDLSLSSRPTPETWTYATPVEDAANVSFRTFEDEVRVIGVGAGIPKEPCA